MPSWTREQLLAYATKQASAGRKAPCTKPKQIVQDAPVAKVERKTLYTGRVLISIISYRRRLCDEDGLIGKWFLDAARYACLVRDDSPEFVSYNISQVKVEAKEEERTEIIFEPVK